MSAAYRHTNRDHWYSWLNGHSLFMMTISGALFTFCAKCHGISNDANARGNCLV